MNASPIDTQAILAQTSHQDVVQRKLSMDSLRSRLGDTRTKDDRLKEACEGFESVFIQKMWEQMRKSVPKEGYLHSKDEETYQSMFDVELSKKMASAGGIGLADMMYQQLSQQVTDTARTTHTKVDMLPAHVQVTAEAAAKEVTTAKLTEDDLYTSMPVVDDTDNETITAQPDESEHKYSGVSAVIASAISALKKEVGGALFGPESSRADLRDAAADSAEMMASHTNGDVKKTPVETVQPGMTANDVYAMMEHQAQSDKKSEEVPVGPLAVNSTGAGHVQAAQQAAASAMADAFEPQVEGIGSTKADTETKTTPKGAFPEGAQWPHPGQVFSHFGWQNDPAGGKRVWNAGIGIAAKSGDTIVPCLPGKVAYIGPREGAGSSVVLEHEGGFVSFYGNVDPHAAISVGDKITSGTAFASVSAEQFTSFGGENIAPLFFELKRGEMALNPESALKSTMTASISNRGPR